MLRSLNLLLGFSKPVETDFKQIAINANYRIKCGNSSLAERQRIEIAEKFEEASVMGSNEITMPVNIHPKVLQDLLAVGYTVVDGTLDDYHNAGGNVVQFRQIPCKIIKLPPDST